MRPFLTIASSLRSNDPWWRNVSLPSEMVTATVGRLARAIAEAAGANEPVTGVAITIRAPGYAGYDYGRLAPERHSPPNPSPEAAEVVVF